MQRDDSSWLKISYFVLTLILALAFWKVFEFIGLKTGLQDQYTSIYSVGITVGSILISAGLVWWLGSNKERHEYFLSSIGEVRKMVWPTWEYTKKLTLIVCVVVGIFAVILSLFDLVWGRILKLILV